MSWMKINDAVLKLPELLIHGRFSYDFDKISLVSKNMAFRKKANLIKTGIDMMLRTSKVKGMPPIIQVEPANVCNLSCPLCPSGSEVMKRKKGFMSIKTFTHLIDESKDYLLAVILYGWGEPFLNKELPQMIELCTQRNIHTVTSTNGHTIQTLEDALKVVDAGLSALIIALDGSVQEVYDSYRKGGDLNKVLKCVRLIEEAKALRGSRLPYTNLRAVVTQYNHNDLSNIKKLANELKVDMFSLKTLGCMPDNDKFENYVPADPGMRRFANSKRHLNGLNRFLCPYPFRQPTVFWDGTVVGCEFDFDAEMSFGKIGDESFLNIWNSKSVAELRKEITESKGGLFCHRCPYKERRQDGNIISCIPSGIESQKMSKPVKTIFRDTTIMGQIFRDN